MVKNNVKYVFFKRYYVDYILVYIYKVTSLINGKLVINKQLVFKELYRSEAYHGFRLRKGGLHSGEFGGSRRGQKIFKNGLYLEAVLTTPRA